MMNCDDEIGNSVTNVTQNDDCDGAVELTRFQQYQNNTHQRLIKDNEIVVDIDDRGEHGCRCVSATCIKLIEMGYHIELWYALGQKTPHVHLRDIQGLEGLNEKQLKEYKIAFLKKYIPEEFWKKDSKGKSIIPDYSLCNKNHLIAEENKPHFKYKTLKILRSEFNQGNLNLCENEIYLKAISVKEEEYTPVVNGSGITAKLIQAINIKDIAEQFGLEVHKNKCLCPFHADNQTPSLVFYEKQGRYCCFGCQTKGNLIDFYARLKEINPSFRYKKPQEVKQ